MTLDKTLAERSQLNENIVQAINHAADSWGIRCLRYEVRIAGKRPGFGIVLSSWSDRHHLVDFFDRLDSGYPPAGQCGQRDAPASLGRTAQTCRNREFLPSLFSSTSLPSSNKLNQNTFLSRGQLESEGARQAAINVAEGRKRAIVLESEGNKEKQINQAAGTSSSSSFLHFLSQLYN